MDNSNNNNNYHNDTNGQFDIPSICFQLLDRGIKPSAPAITSHIYQPLLDRATSLVAKVGSGGELDPDEMEALESIETSEAMIKNIESSLSSPTASRVLELMGSLYMKVNGNRFRQVHANQPHVAMPNGFPPDQELEPAMRNHHQKRERDLELGSDEETHAPETKRRRVDAADEQQQHHQPAAPRTSTTPNSATVPKQQQPPVVPPLQPTVPPQQPIVPHVPEQAAPIVPTAASSTAANASAASLFNLEKVNELVKLNGSKDILCADMKLITATINNFDVTPEDLIAATNKRVKDNNLRYPSMKSLVPKVNYPEDGLSESTLTLENFSADAIFAIYFASIVVYSKRSTSSTQKPRQLTNAASLVSYLQEDFEK